MAAQEEVTVFEAKAKKQNNLIVFYVRKQVLLSEQTFYLLLRRMAL